MTSDDKPKKATRQPRPPRKTTRNAETTSAGLTSAEVNAAPATAAQNTEEPAIPVERASELGTSDERDGLDTEVRRRAYEIYLSRGGQGGDHVADWLEAERIVRGGGSRATNQEQNRDATSP